MSNTDKPVLELASLRLNEGTKVTDEYLLSILRQAKQAMEASSGLGDFLYLQQVEDPAIIYIVGRWPSVAYHYDVFIPSAVNQHILKALADKVSVEWLFHVDVSQNILPFTKAPVTAIVRHFLAPGERPAFDATFARYNSPLTNATNSRMEGGWRVDKEEEAKEEWVLFTGWERVEEHTAFGDSEEFKEYAKIKDHLVGAEVKHAVTLHL